MKHNFNAPGAFWGSTPPLTLQGVVNVLQKEAPYSVQGKSNTQIQALVQNAKLTPISGKSIASVAEQFHPNYAYETYILDDGDSWSFAVLDHTSGYDEGMTLIKILCADNTELYLLFLGYYYPEDLASLRANNNELLDMITEIFEDHGITSKDIEAMYNTYDLICFTDTDT